jgi:hypothetical protein
MTLRQAMKSTNGNRTRKNPWVSYGREIPKRAVKTHGKSSKAALRAVVKKVIREECNAVTCERYN